ncbi:amidase [Aquibium carbonis]|uniref:Indoleacetamide hydrolase n=1 Tax=Aquibium carbonis TaxID=2495581 RepID=A0A429YYH1_9HYPH|nr:amidase [Aquibium carbonis]RST86526.1 amidase [Aquibium carbonis]
MNEFETLLWENDATGLAALVRSGDVAPAELVEAAITRAEATSHDINAIAEKLFDQARAMARTVDRALPFAGVPFAIKDLAMGIAGVPMHSGSRAPMFVPEVNSTLVDRQIGAGLIPIATSTTPEYGLRLVTESARFGVTRNPWNNAHVTGGSSGGAAALVSAGVVPMAHASDGGGSIRVPAACCGLVGLKTSRGRTPAGPLFSETWFGFVVEHAVTRSVRDTALLLDLTHGPDATAPYAARPQKGAFAAAAARAPGPLAIGVFRRSPLGLGVSRETLDALDQAAALAREGGHAVTEIDLPMIDRTFMADFARTVASSIAGLMRLEAVRNGRSILGDVERATRVLARFGEVMSAGELYAGLERLHAASRALIAHTAPFDAVLMPVIAHPPVPVGGMDARGVDETVENVLDRLRLTRLLSLDPIFSQLMDKSLWFTHWPAIQNVTGQPSIAMPVHVTAEGLPIGIQAAGRPGDEETLLSFAAQMETLSGWTCRRAPLRRPG